jgi:hypothetical protein
MRRSATAWNQFASSEGTLMRWRRRGLWQHDLRDDAGSVLCSVQKVPFQRTSMTLRGQPCHLRRPSGSTKSGWAFLNASGHKLLNVTGNDMGQTEEPVVTLQHGERIVFTVTARRASRAVLSCIDMRSNLPMARLRWRSRSWWRSLSTIEVLVEPPLVMTDPVVALVLLASVDFLPQAFGTQWSGP